MSTSRPPDPPPLTLPTSELSTSQQHRPTLSLTTELLSVGLLQPLTGPVEGLKQQDNCENFTTPQGMSSLHHVTGLFRRGASWEVQRKEGDSETFDAVVLTMPVPQIIQLQGE
ncbi:hypothetical protein INR49_008074, partial [Caranx melampygus]